MGRPWIPTAHSRRASRSAWRRGTLDFQPSPVVVIPADGYLVVCKNRAAFDARYGAMPGGVEVYEYDSGNLDNGGEKLEISKPGDTDTLGRRYWIRVDRVNYSDGSHPGGEPGDVDLWPTEADGEGKSLNRIEPEDYGNDPINWIVPKNPTPGT